MRSNGKYQVMVPCRRQTIRCAQIVPPGLVLRDGRHPEGSILQGGSGSKAAAAAESIRSWALLFLTLVIPAQARVACGEVAQQAIFPPSTTESAHRIPVDGSSALGKGELEEAVFVKEFREGAVVARIRILRRLSVLNEPWVTEFLVSACADTDAQVRAEALSILGWKGYQPAEGIFVKALEDPDAQVRFAAARALGKVKQTEAAVDGLIGRLQDKETHVRCQAILTLWSIKDVKAIDPLIVCLRGQDQEVQAMASGALSDIGIPAINRVKVLLHDTDSKVRIKVAWILFSAQGPHRQEIPALLKDPVKEVRSAAANILTRMEWSPASLQEKIHYLLAQDDWKAVVKIGRDAVPALLEIAGDNAWQDRATPMRALAELEDSRAIRTFLHGAMSSDAQVRSVSLDGLLTLVVGSLLKFPGPWGIILLVLARFTVSVRRVIAGLAQGLRDRRAALSQPGIKARSAVRTWARVFLTVEGTVATGVFVTAICLLLFRGVDHGVLVLFLPAMVLLAAFDAVRIAFWLSSRRLATVRTERKKSFLGKWTRRIGAFVVASAIALNVVSVNALLIGTSLAKNTLPVKAAVESPVLEVADLSKMQSAAQAAIRDLPSAYLSSNQKERLAATLLQLEHTRSPSRQEGDVRAIVKNILEGLQAREINCRPWLAFDVPLNLVMEIPATPGYEYEQTLILNAHMDTIPLDQCHPEMLVFDGDKKMLHAQGMPFGADDKVGVTVVVESLRVLKENYWDKGYGHRRIVVIITAREEEQALGARYLFRNYRGIFADAQISLTVDGDLGPWATDAGRPFVIAVPRQKENDLKYKKIVDAVEELGRQRGIPVVNGYDLGIRGLDASAFPPEAFREIYFRMPYLGRHTNERVYLVDLVNYTDLLAHVVYTLDAEIQVHPTR